MLPTYPTGQELKPFFLLICNMFHALFLTFWTIPQISAIRIINDRLINDSLFGTSYPDKTCHRLSQEIK